MRYDGTSSCCDDGPVWYGDVVYCMMMRKVVHIYILNVPYVFF